MQVAENGLAFQWDKANQDKIWRKHRVTKSECEEVFFNVPMFVFPDVKHSQREKRFYVLGRTNAGRLLFVVFTIRVTLVRVISARDMNKKERKEYHEKAQENTKV